jgi:hypothetical protein
LGFVWLSDPLLGFSFNLAIALLCLQFFFFLFILMRHRARVRRQGRIEEARLAFEAIFATPESPVMSPVAQVSGLSDKELLVSWVRAAQRKPFALRGAFAQHAKQEGVFNCLPSLLQSRKISDRSLACEAIGLARLEEFIDVLKRLEHHHNLSPYVCHALTRISSSIGASNTLAAHEARRITNGELLKIMGELDPEEFERCLHEHPEHRGTQVLTRWIRRPS